MGTMTERLRGNLDLLVLHALAHAPMHGWAIAQRLQTISRDMFQVAKDTKSTKIFSVLNPLCTW